LVQLVLLVEEKGLIGCIGWIGFIGLWGAGCVLLLYPQRSSVFVGVALSLRRSGGCGAARPAAIVSQLRGMPLPPGKTTTLKDPSGR
jgi:hypothetical protein